MKHALLVVGFLASPALAQPKAAITPAQRAAADDAFNRADWTTAATAYEALAAVEDHPAQHGRLGTALVEIGKPREAIAQLEKALAIIPNPRFALYLARAHARLGETDAALAALDKMVTLGGVPVAMLSGVKEFAAFTSQKRFTDAVANNRVAIEPCRAAPEFRQFDFWIGEWKVKDRGTFAHYGGGFADGKMTIVADQSANGKPALARMTFSKLANGDVRQFGEASSDGGKTWTAAFDLVYSKRG